MNRKSRSKKLEINNNICDSKSCQKIKISKRKSSASNSNSKIIKTKSNDFICMKSSNKGNSNIIPNEDSNKDQYLIENFTKVTEKNIVYEVNFSQMERILTSDNLNSSSEEDVFNTLVKWASKNKGISREKLCKLFKQIRYIHLSKTFLAKTVLDYFDSCNFCMETCKKILRWHLNPSMRSEMDIDVTDRRYHNKCLLHISTNKTLEYVNIKIFNKSGLVDLTITSNMKYSCAALLMDQLILFGGVSNEDVTKRTWSIDLLSKEILNIECMSQERIFFDIAIVDKNVYAIGGMDRNRQGMKFVEMWNSFNNKWEEVEPLNSARCHHAAVVHCGKIYVFGGYYGKKYLKSFEIYDIEKKTWTEHKISDDIFCYDFCHPKAVTLNDDIYVYECFKKSSKPKEHHVKRMNVKDKNWTKIPPLPILQQCHNLVNFNGKILFFGVKDNFQYDPDNNKWSTLLEYPIIPMYNHILCLSTTHLRNDEYL